MKATFTVEVPEWSIVARMAELRAKYGEDNFSMTNPREYVDEVCDDVFDAIADAFNGLAAHVESKVEGETMTADLPQHNQVKSVTVYRDEAGEWRWTATAFNNKTVAASGEGYVNKSHAVSQAATLFPGATVLVPDD